MFRKSFLWVLAVAAVAGLATLSLAGPPESPRPVRVPKEPAPATPIPMLPPVVKPVVPVIKHPAPRPTPLPWFKNPAPRPTPLPWFKNFELPPVVKPLPLPGYGRTIPTVSGKGVQPPTGTLPPGMLPALPPGNPTQMDDFQVFIYFFEWLLEELAQLNPPPPSSPLVDHLDIDIDTGSDDVRDGSHVVFFAWTGPNYQEHSVDMNGGAKWDNWTPHANTLVLPPGTRVSDIHRIAVQFTTGSGVWTDDWDMQGIRVTYGLGQPSINEPFLVNLSDNPLMYFDGDHPTVEWTLDIQP
jgi:hypothetical protein